MGKIEDFNPVVDPIILSLQWYWSPGQIFIIGFFSALKLKKLSKFNLSKEKIQNIKKWARARRGRAKRLFYDAYTRSNGLLLVPNNKGVMIRGCLGRQSFDLLLGLRSGSRSAYFVYIAYCTAQKRWICHISRNFEEAWAKEMEGRKVC